MNPPQQIDAAAIDMGVYVVYAGAMHRVQGFERMLALLVLALESNPSDRRFRSPQHFYASTGKMISKMVDRFQKASAKGLRNLLPDDFDEALLEEIDALILWRDRLAHRYLVENARAAPPGQPHFTPGAFLELWQVGNEFQAMTGRLFERYEARVATSPKSDAPEGVKQLYTELARSILLGEEFKPSTEDDSDTDQRPAA